MFRLQFWITTLTVAPLLVLAVQRSLARPSHSLQDGVAELSQRSPLSHEMVPRARPAF